MLVCVVIPERKHCPFSHVVHSVAEDDPIALAAASAAKKLALKLSNSNNDIASRSTSAPVPREHQKLDHNVLYRSLREFYAEQQLKNNANGDSKLPTVDEHEHDHDNRHEVEEEEFPNGAPHLAASASDLMCDSPSPPRRVKKSPRASTSASASGVPNGVGVTRRRRQNPENFGADTDHDADASNDEMDISLSPTLSDDDGHLNLGNSSAQSSRDSQSSTSSSKCDVRRTLTYAASKGMQKRGAAGGGGGECAENPEEGSNTDTDMHDQELLLSRSSLVSSALRKISASSLSKKRKRSPRKGRMSLFAGAAAGAFRAELAQQANQIALQIQRFSASLHEVSVLSDVHSSVSPMKSPPSKRHSSIDRFVGYECL